LEPAPEEPVPEEPAPDDAVPAEPALEEPVPMNVDEQAAPTAPDMPEPISGASDAQTAIEESAAPGGSVPHVKTESPQVPLREAVHVKTELPGANAPYPTCYRLPSAVDELMTDVIHYASVGADARPRRRFLISQMDHAIEELQTVRDYVRQQDFWSDPDIIAKGFEVWMEKARAHDYHSLEPDHVLRLAASRRHSNEPTEGIYGLYQPIRDILPKLYKDDFEIFVQHAIGTCEPTGGLSRLEAFEKTITICPPLVAVQVALFASVTNPWSVSKEKLQWIIYLFNSQFDIPQVYAMSKAELVVHFNSIAGDLANNANLA
jgi:hypothetical protein